MNFNSIFFSQSFQYFSMENLKELYRQLDFSEFAMRCKTLLRKELLHVCDIFWMLPMKQLTTHNHFPFVTFAKSDINFHFEVNS